MARLSKDEILKIARLARLRLSDADIIKYQHELDAILSYVEQLQAIDTSAVKPTVQVTGLVNVMRDDMIVDYGVNRNDLLANAPHHEAGQFKVRRVLG